VSWEKSDALVVGRGKGSCMLAGHRSSSINFWWCIPEIHLSIPPEPWKSFFWWSHYVPEQN